MRNPYQTAFGQQTQPVEIDYQLANQWITWISAKLLEGACVLVEQIEPSVRSYVVGKLANCPSVVLGDIGDGRDCLWFERPEPLQGEWRPLTMEIALVLIRGDHIYNQETQQVIDVTNEWSAWQGGLGIGTLDTDDSDDPEDWIPSSEYRLSDSEFDKYLYWEPGNE